MNEPAYEAKRRYQAEPVADVYDSRRFSGLKGRLTDSREMACVSRALSRARPSGPILDIPCGTGRITELLLREGFQVTAGDISDAMIERARKRLKDFESQVRFVKCDIEDLQFPENSFELIATVRLLHHIPPALHARILGQLHRATRKWVILSFSNKYTLQNLRRNVMSVFTKFPRYSISPALFRREVQTAGFEIVDYMPLFPFVSESVFVLLRKE